MTTILQFVFSDIWHFIGCQIVFMVVCKGIAAIVGAAERLQRKPKSEREVLIFVAGIEAERDFKISRILGERRN